MRALPSVLLVASLVAICACHPRRLSRASFGSPAHPISVGEALVCPDHVGDLQRSSAAADGRSCAYAGPQDEDVQLSLMPLGGQDAEARLATLDGTLRSELPAASAAAHGQGVYVGADKGTGEAHIDLPGFHLNASDDKAGIRLPGVSINADGDDAKVSTSLGGHVRADVQAHDGGAEIRTGGVNANGAALTFLLASNTPGPGGYRVVGYRAKGPAKGPLVVAVFRARGEDRRGDSVDEHGLDRLVDMNVHG